MITLASDFGTPYPAAMKGVLLRLSGARHVDIAHDFPRQDVRTAAFWLREVLPQFPPAVHLVVVDPGVGTDRAAIVIRAGEHALVGPDNGVLVPPARALCTQQNLDREAFEIFEISVDGPVSHTFHGRDVFAPAAARIHETGVESLDNVAGITARDRYEDLEFPDPTIDGTAAVGEILAVDRFGNAITNVTGDALAPHFGTTITVNGQRVATEPSYDHVAPSARLVTVGSHGMIELAANRGRGDEAFDVAVGDAVRFGFE